MALGVLVCSVLLGCSTTQCHLKRLESMKGKEDTKEKTVRVFRYDGTLQCAMGKAIPLNDMARDLKDIPVISSTQLSDGLLRIQLCGSPTGDANVYEISESHLEKAKTLGFREWTFGDGTRGR